MIDGGDVGAPGWRNDGYGQCFEIGEGCKCKGDAQGPERPVGEQANGPDHDEKPSGLGGTRVIAWPASVLPETRGGGNQVGGKGRNEPGDVSAQCLTVHHHCPDQ